MRILSTILVLLSYPVFCSAASKEIIELQRDLASLQDQVKTMQRSLDENLSAMRVLMQQTLDTANKTNTGVAVMQSGVGEQLKRGMEGIVAPVVGVGSKIDTMLEQFRYMAESIKDVNTRIDKLQAQVVDVGNAVKIINTAPPPPPPVSQSNTGGPATGSAPGGPPPGVSADQLYQSAFRDYSSQNDMAFQEFSDFLKWFGNTDLAPNAQFYLGMIAYNKSDWPGAIGGFDKVLALPQNNKTPDAMFMRGKALLKSGQRTAAADQFLEVIKAFPDSEQAAKAKAERKNLGLSSGAPATKSTKKRAK